MKKPHQIFGSGGLCSKGQRRTQLLCNLIRLEKDQRSSNVSDLKGLQTLSTVAKTET